MAKKLKASKTRYFIEVDGCILLQPHPGPRDAAFRAALDNSPADAALRVIVVEGDDPFSEAAKRSFYDYDRVERRWVLRGE